MNDKKEGWIIKSAAEIHKEVVEERERVDAEIVERNKHRKRPDDKVIALFGKWEVQQDGTLCYGSYNHDAMFPLATYQGYMLAEGNWPLFFSWEQDSGDAIRAYFFALRHLGVKEVTMPTKETYFK